MKLQICAEIEGKFLLKEAITTKLHPYEFAVFEKDGRRFISVTKPVKDYLKFAPTVKSKNGILEIKATEPEIYKDLLNWLVYIEAMGAFNFEVSEIHKDELEVTWIPESEEEKGIITITSMKRNREERKADKHLTSSRLFDIVSFRRQLPDAYIPYTYYRQAKTFFDNGNYYFAYINYYMMLEYCFADGQFIQKVQRSNFKSSLMLKYAVLNAMYLFRTQGEPNYSAMLALCHHHQKEYNFEHIVWLLVEYRGILAHGLAKSIKFYLDDRNLRPLTLFISLVCFWICGNMQVYCCSTDKFVEERVLGKIEELEKKLKTTL